MVVAEVAGADPAAAVPAGKPALAQATGIPGSPGQAWSCPVCGCAPQLLHSGPPSSGRLSLLLDWLASNHQTPGLRAGDIAAAAGISPRQLQAICKRRFGCTPMHLLAGIRMHRAHMALTGQEQPAAATIADAARIAGISRVSRFRAAYRGRYGIEPVIVSPERPSQPSDRRETSQAARTRTRTRHR